MARPFSANPRIAVIDALRGVAMLLMLVDHAREFFFLHQQVADPMRLEATSPALFFTRLTSHFCAPVFVFLTGLAAWCHGQKADAERTTTGAYLTRRGLLLVALEVTVINFAWTFSLAPGIVYLQVIWAIGLSMLALAGLLRLPAPARIGLGVLLVAGHHLLDGVRFAPGDAAFPIWAILHDRSVIELADGLKVRTSYPVLPWIGVILLGHAAGPLYGKGVTSACRRRWLTGAGLGALMSFGLLRWIDAYGDRPRVPAATPLGEVMSWLNVTKYPPSLLFVLLTLGVAALLLAWLERVRPPAWLLDFGRVPMFFYILHLYALHGLHLLASALSGPNQGSRFGFDHVWQVWLLAALVGVALYPACRWFAARKRAHPGGWRSYL